MKTEEKFMKRCLQLAAKGSGKVEPNPMVGCVIVRHGKIIGEGYHRLYGKAHAEVNAIRSVKNKTLLKESVLYVSLEPCSHYGKTPPCSDLIIRNRIPEVVIGSSDSNPLVKGKGIAKLRAAGIKVRTGVLEKECRELNRRFFTFFEKKRPYIILKWAQTADGFLDRKRSPGDGLSPLQVSNAAAKKISHQWRAEEMAILVGTNTALLDDPQLTTRNVKGRDPLRLVIDELLSIPRHSHLLDGSVPTLVFTSVKKKSRRNVSYAVVPFKKGQASLETVLNVLAHSGIQSLVVEGGARLLNSFTREKKWDEARVFISRKRIVSGVKAPSLPGQPTEQKTIGTNRLLIFRST